MAALKQNKSLDFFKQNAIYFVLLILLGIIIVQDPTFLNLRNFSNILTQSSVRLIIALGVAGLLVTQGTDLSAGRQVGLAAVISATLLQAMDNFNRVFPDLPELPIPVGNFNRLCDWCSHRFSKWFSYCLLKRNTIYCHHGDHDYCLWD